MRVDKRKIVQWSKKHINPDNVKTAILFLPLLFLLIEQVSRNKFSISEFLDVGVLVSFVFVFISEIIAKAISRYIGKRCEDEEKLAVDSEALVKKYSREMVFEYNGVKYPEILLCLRQLDQRPFAFEICHENKNCHYNLPSQVADNSNWLMEAHRHSVVFNNMNVRLDNLETDSNRVRLTYSKTTYYDSLITNRAMDYPLANNKTIREIYEPGPFLSALSQSKFSNHLGFNGFVQLSDGNVIFVKRSENVSIGKRTLGTSIGASYKVKYGLEDDGTLSVKRISEAIRKEIADELKIDVPDSKNLADAIFAFYRDLVEGGKPQFLFFYRVEDYDKKKFETNFKKKMRDSAEKNKNEKVLVDGTEFEFIQLDKLSESSIGTDTVEINGKTYHMMPSAAASVAMLLKAREKD